MDEYSFMILSYGGSGLCYDCVLLCTEVVVAVMVRDNGGGA